MFTSVVFTVLILKSILFFPHLKETRNFDISTFFCLSLVILRVTFYDLLPVAVYFSE